MGPALYSGASALSWLFQLIALPFYSARIAAYEMMARMTVEAQKQWINAHVQAFDTFITTGKELEQKLAQAHTELELDVLKQLATDTFETTLLRMKQEFDKDLPHHTTTDSE